MRIKSKFWTKADWVLLVLILAALGVSFLLASSFPATVPVHWNILGEPDRYGSKYINLFLLPLLSLALLGLMSWLPKLDPLGKNYERFAVAYQAFKVILSGFFLYLYVIIVYASYFEIGFSGALFFVPAFSILFIILGYYLPQLKRNFFIGIRTPWTLTSDKSWDKSHLWAGRVLVAGGIVNLLGLIIRPAAYFFLLIAILLLASAGILIYSYFIYRADKNKKEL